MSFSEFFRNNISRNKFPKPNKEVTKRTKKQTNDEVLAMLDKLSLEEKKKLINGNTHSDLEKKAQEQLTSEFIKTYTEREKKAQEESIAFQALSREEREKILEPERKRQEAITAAYARHRPDYNPNRGGKSRKWSAKYKKSINCKRPKGFSQKQHCKRRRTRKTHK